MALLRDADGEATSNFWVLSQYADHAPPEARFYLKVPRTYFSRIFTAADGTVVARLLTPLNVRHAEAYARAHPFDAAVEEISGTEQAKKMVMDVTALLYQAEQHGYLFNIITNNRAWGMCPF